MPHRNPTGIYQIIARRSYDPSWRTPLRFLCRRRHNVHLLRVTIRILCHYRVTDPDVACAGLLHDAVEDHAALVAAVTNPAWEPGRDKHEQYREHVLAALQAGPWARVIKASDFTDNAVGIIHTTGPKLPELARKYGPAGPGPARAHPAPGPPLEDDVTGTIAAQLDAAQARPPPSGTTTPAQFASAWSCAGAKPGTLGGETA